MPKVSVSLPFLSETGARSTEASLNGEAEACGCGPAGVAASIAVLGYVVLLFGTSGSPPRWDGSDFVIGAVVALTAGILGKLAGIALARRRWLAQLHDLAAGGA